MNARDVRALDIDSLRKLVRTIDRQGGPYFNDLDAQGALDLFWLADDQGCDGIIGLYEDNRYKADDALATARLGTAERALVIAEGKCEKGT